MNLSQLHQATQGAGTQISQGLALLAHNPPRFARTVYARVAPRPRSPVWKRIGGVDFECDFRYGPLVRQMYYGLYEPETVQVMRRLLRAGDTVVDAGANIGYLSAVALSLVGPSGQVHSFEPVPRYFARLAQLAATNPAYHLVANHSALGDREGTAQIHINGAANIGWNTLVAGFMRAEAEHATQSVPVRRLDTYLREQRLDRVALIKIDTEGYELPVLRGLSSYLDGATRRPPILCEVAPAAYPLLGQTLTGLSALLRAYGYRAYGLGALTVPLDLTRLTETTTLLFRPSKGGNAWQH